jgi:hypothetical protein
MIMTDDWDVDWGSEWETQMEERGYVLLQDDEIYTGAERIARLCELRWGPPDWADTVPSTLWDASTPSVGRVRLTPQTVALSERIIDGNDEIPEYGDPDDDEWIAYDDDDDDV